VSDFVPDAEYDGELWCGECQADTWHTGHRFRREEQATCEECGTVVEDRYVWTQEPDPDRWYDGRVDREADGLVC
jgi:NAD-dependent SIR2 family protein deacetylase